jgi:phospholipase C
MESGEDDKWVPAHRKVNKKTAPYVMGYYTREDIPFQFALAETFTICDAYHCSVLGPTSPNRMYWFTGTIDPEGKHGRPMTSNHVPREGFRWTTYAERLEKAGVSWKVYQQKKIHPGYDKLQNFKIFREADKNSPLYKKGIEVRPSGQFEYDAINDNLSAVSWLIPNNYQSEHPDYLPADGATFVASKIDAIAANPKVWGKTVFILAFDENDGLFDHVAPPVPDPGTDHEFVNGEPIGAGFRVPCIVISPWTAGGWVCSDLFDHTSALQFLEKFTGVKEPNISQWRRDTFGDLTSTFRFEDKADETPPTLPDTHGPLIRAKYEVKHFPKPEMPSGNQKMPTQEKGTRPSDS